VNLRWQRLRSWARAVKRDVHAVYLAARDPRVPWYAKLAAGLVAAYALSPIDLIPDFIPVLGYGRMAATARPFAAGGLAQPDRTPTSPLLAPLVGGGSAA
jgi:hypothetical protein